ncbi:MAG TPA: site-specific DNA-methyltransferase [Nitrososphaeraceae archaeon]|nr:site-specific DNA-methyltransferase [Nitrososphaeraceae archaeon]
MNKLIEENSIKIDAIVTSPPYNINKPYSEYNDRRDKIEYLSWLQKIAKKSIQILKEDGSFFLNIGARSTDFMLPFEICKNFIEIGYKLQNTIHWIKSISIEIDDIGKNNLIKNNSSIGHFKPIVSKRFLSDLHEYIFHFTKKGDLVIDKLAIGVVYQDKSNIGRWKSAKTDKRDRGNIWFIPYNTIQEKGPHPAIFPEKLPQLCIKLHGIKKNTIIYDPFIGIGTTALACINLNVDFVGTEIDKKYIKIANEKIKFRYRNNKKQQQQQQQ